MDYYSTSGDFPWAIRLGRKAIQNWPKPAENLNVLRAIRRLEEKEPSPRRPTIRCDALLAAMAEVPSTEWHREQKERLTAMCGSRKGRNLAYLLLDPRKYGAPNAPKSFEAFVSSVFYVGEGHASRPDDHIKDTRRSPEPLLASRKIRRIAELLRIGEGVGQVIVEEERVKNAVSTIEDSVLQALGASQAPTRCVPIPEKTARWTRVELDHVGTFLLYRAWINTLLDGLHIEF